MKLREYPRRKNENIKLLLIENDDMKMVDGRDEKYLDAEVMEVVPEDDVTEIWIMEV